MSLTEAPPGGATTPNQLFPQVAPADARCRGREKLFLVPLEFAAELTGRHAFGSLALTEADLTDGPGDR